MRRTGGVRPAAWPCRAARLVTRSLLSDHGSCARGRASGEPASRAAREGAPRRDRAAGARRRRAGPRHAQPGHDESRLEPVPRLDPVRPRTRALRRRTPRGFDEQACRTRRGLAPLPPQRPVHRHGREVARRVRGRHALVRRGADRRGGDDRPRSRVRLAVPRAGRRRATVGPPRWLGARVGRARAERCRRLPRPRSSAGTRGRC